ncbi:MAG: DNA polymerase III subunit delta' [Candidatus Cloacimonas sp.]|nr:DNA polymerase III subunit delta' [Candidatus Cloacimonadota bacterium]
MSKTVLTMTMFDKIKGQEQAINILKRSIKERKIASSYLFHGPEGVGKFTTALYFAMAVNCLAESEEERPCGQCISCYKTSQLNHPDLFYVFPAPNFKVTSRGEIEDNKLLAEYEKFISNKRESPWKEFFFGGNIEIRIDSIRLLMSRINLSAVEGRYKVFIIENADMMNISTANAFLKTLEEPPKDTIIILTSARPESMLQTIHSRCQKVSFYKLSRQIIEEELTEERGVDQIVARMVARIADGNMEKAISMAEEQDNDSREQALKFMQFALNRDDLGFISFIDYYRSSKTQSELKEIIQNLIIWVSDLLFSQESPDDVVNVDKLQFLDSVAQKIPALDIQLNNFILFLETMLKKLEGNVNPHLISIEIYFKLVRLFK